MTGALRRGSELLLESDHHLARLDLRAGNLTEGRGPEARIRIPEHRMVEDVLDVDSHLEPLPGSDADILEQHGVEDLNGLSEQLRIRGAVPGTSGGGCEKAVASK